jgi:hypothetical protein
MFRMLGNLTWTVSVVCLLGGMYGRLYGWTPHQAVAPTMLIVVGVVALVVGGTFHGLAEKGAAGKAGNA